MAFKLTKTEAEQKTELVEKLAETWANVEAAEQAYNDAMVDVRQELVDAVAAYNAAAEEANQFCADIASQAAEDIGNKSEKWQEGDKGQAAQEWQSAWEGVQIDSIEMDEIEEVSISPPTFELEDLSDDAEG